MALSPTLIILFLVLGATASVFIGVFLFGWKPGGVSAWGDVCDYFREILIIFSCCISTTEDRAMIDEVIDNNDIVIFTRKHNVICQAAVELIQEALGPAWTPSVDNKAPEFPVDEVLEKEPVKAPATDESSKKDSETEQLTFPQYEVDSQVVRIVEVSSKEVGIHMALQEAAGLTAPNFDSWTRIVDRRSHCVSYPWIFVHGHLVTPDGGGYERLTKMVVDCTLEGIIARPRVPHSEESYPNGRAWWQPAVSAAGLGPGGYLLQARVYPNVYRCMALLHMCIFASCLIVEDKDYSGGWALFYCFDCLVFIFAGPIPSPLGMISQFLMWRRRGEHISAVPYKIVSFVSVVALLPVIFSGTQDDIDASSIVIVFNQFLITVFRF